MREMLFRGKWLGNGEWVEGYYCKISETTYAFAEDYERNPIPVHHYILQEVMTDWGLPNRFNQYEVDPETLCQYTGLNDKNGKRIWENDIVRCNRREKEAKYKVVWDKTYADFRIEKLNGLGCMPICIEEVNTPVFGRHYECIGNVFDNPELLKKQ